MAFQFKKYKKEDQSELSESEIKNAMLPSEFWLVCLVFFLLYIYYTPLYLINTGGFLEGFLRGVVPIIVFPFLIYKTVRSFKPKSKWRIWLPVLSIIGIGPILVGINQYQFNRILSSNVKNTKSILIKEIIEKVDKQNKLVKVPHFFLQYSAEGESFKPRIDPVNFDTTTYQAGDTIELIYSQDHPNIYKISEIYRLQKTVNTNTNEPL